MQTDRELLDSIVRTFVQRRAELQTELDDIDRKELAVREAFTGIVASESNSRPAPNKKSQREPSVPDQTYVEVLDYLHAHPDSRQADIAGTLKINSGIISQAMKIALEKKEVRADREGRGARYKTTVSYRESVVHAGDGVRSGRLTERGKDAHKRSRRKSTTGT